MGGKAKKRRRLRKEAIERQERSYQVYREHLDNVIGHLEEMIAIEKANPGELMRRHEKSMFGSSNGLGYDASNLT